MASSGVNVKMGVSGVQAFKQNMKTAQSSVKTLDQALALNEKQFRATGDSQEYMATKTALLQKKIEEQKSIITNAEKALAQMSKNGVDKASDSFQKMQQQLLKAKGDLLDAENALNGIDEAGGDAADGVSGMNTQLAKIGQGIAWDNVTNGLSSITTGIENVIKKAWKMGEALVTSTLGAGAWADELKTDAEKYGLSVEELQRMQKTAALIDTSVEDIVTAQQKMNRGLGSADQGVMGAFAHFGLDPNAMETTEDKFWAIGEAINSLTDAEEQEAYAQKVFGKGWQDLRPLFNAGRDSYEEMNESWSVVSEENIEKLGEMDDQYQKLANEWETFKMTVLSAFSGPMQVAMEKLTGFLEKLNVYLESPEGQQALDNLGQTVTALIEELINVNPDDVVSAVADVIGDIQKAFKWIQEHSDDVAKAIEVIGGAFVALKLGTVATQIMSIISNLKIAQAAAGASTGASTATTAGAVGLKAGLAKLGAGAGSLLPGLGIGTAITAEAALALYSMWGLYKSTTGFLFGGEEMGDEYDAENMAHMREDIEAHGGLWEEIDRMEQVNEENGKATSKMSDSADKMQELPSSIAETVAGRLTGMAVVLDGQKVGEIVSSSVGAKQAGWLTYLIK